MPGERYTAVGTRRPHELAPGYQHHSRNNGRWERGIIASICRLDQDRRAIGELPFSEGVVVMLFVAIVFSLGLIVGWAVFGG